MNRYLKILLVLPIAVQAQNNSGSLNEFNNFDFKAGEKILFEDNGSGYKSGIAPTNWKLESGKALAEINGEEKYLSIKEYYTKFSPYLKLKTLPDTFTIEYDTWLDAGYDGNPGIEIHLVNGSNEVLITPNKHVVNCNYPISQNSSKENPEPYFGENKFYNRWVHISIAYQKKHLCIYLDQYKQIDLADCNLKPLQLQVSGNTSQDMKILLKNFKLATGIPEKIEFVNGKFITRAIKFDVNKAELKPESMSVLKEIAAYMNSNPQTKFEIGGHTDNDGNAAANLELSAKRAAAVKNQLVNMGIGSQRLNTKGYGQTLPVLPNTSTENKAANRRVEFTVIN